MNLVTYGHKLTVAPESGLLLPCNVTVSEESDGRILVSIIDPNKMMSLLDNSVLEEIASDAEARLRRVAEALNE